MTNIPCCNIESESGYSCYKNRYPTSRQEVLLNVTALHSRCQVFFAMNYGSEEASRDMAELNKYFLH